MGEATFPLIVVEPVTVTRIDVLEDGADAMRFRVEQRIRSISFAGIFAVVTFPGHEHPKDTS